MVGEQAETADKMLDRVLRGQRDSAICSEAITASARAIEPAQAIQAGEK